MILGQCKCILSTFFFFLCLLAASIGPAVSGQDLRLRISRSNTDGYKLIASNINWALFGTLAVQLCMAIIHILCQSLTLHRYI